LVRRASAIDDFLGVTRHVAHHEIQLSNTNFESHGSRHIVQSKTGLKTKWIMSFAFTQAR
jgi:hypothetical protein